MLLAVFGVFVGLSPVLARPVLPASSDPLRSTLRSDPLISIGYNCSSPDVTASVINLNAVQQCPTDEDETTHTAVWDIQLLQTKVSNQADVKTCLVTKTSVIWICGVLNHAFLLQGSVWDTVSPVSSEECSRLHTEREFTHGDLKVLLRINTTVTASDNVFGEVGDTGHCKGADFAFHGKQYRSAVMSQSITVGLWQYSAPVNVQTGIVKLVGGYSMKLGGSFQHPDLGSTFATVSLSNECTLERLVSLYLGPANFTTAAASRSSDVLISAHIDRNLFAVFLGDPFIACDVSLFLTDQPDIIIYRRAHSHDSLPARRASPAEVDPVKYLNTKLVFLESHVAESTNHLFRRMKRQNCLNRFETLRNRIAVAREHAVTGGLLLTHEAGVISHRTGEVLHTFRCMAEAARLRSTARCYRDLPVTVRGRPVFLAPFSRTITDMSPEVPCSPLSPQMFEFRGNWIQLAPNITPAREPEMLSPIDDKSQWTFARIGSFGVSGLYSLTDLSAFYESLQYPSRIDTAIAVVSGRSSGQSPGLQGLTPQYIITEEELKERASSVFSSMISGVREFGIYAAAAWGFVFILSLMKRVITTFVNGRELFRAFGLSLKLVGSLFTSVTVALLSRNFRQFTASFTALRTESPYETDEPSAPEPSKCAEQVPDGDGGLLYSNLRQ